jgi:hypothetical protein
MNRNLKTYNRLQEWKNILKRHYVQVWMKQKEKIKIYIKD